MNVNLGCPNFCAGYTCVDLYPHSPEVVKDEAVHFLQKQKPASVTRIKSLNLVEHLPNVGLFFVACNMALEPNGTLIIRTDNAEWIPFYIPIINALGWGAHSSDKYWPQIMNGTKHYCVFTKLHLNHFAELYGFKMISCERVTFGARLLAEMVKDRNC